MNKVTFTSNKCCPPPRTPRENQWERKRETAKKKENFSQVLRVNHSGSHKPGCPSVTKSKAAKTNSWKSRRPDTRRDTVNREALFAPPTIKVPRRIDFQWRSPVTLPLSWTARRKVTMSPLHVIKLACYQVAGRTRRPGASWLLSPQHFITGGAAWNYGSLHLVMKSPRSLATKSNTPAQASSGAVKVEGLLSANVTAITRGTAVTGTIMWGGGQESLPVIPRW